ncbi:MAG: hypothetical protein AB1755_02195 [Candidatus Omnitrophota bacterium]
MKRIVLIIFFLFLPLLHNSYSDTDIIRQISNSKTPLKQYELFEASFTVTKSLINAGDFTRKYLIPFILLDKNNQKNNLILYITLPDGETISLPAFYSGKEFVWKIRYRPTKVGDYSYYLMLKTPSEIYISEVNSFNVQPQENNGFLRKNKNNSYYLIFDSGKPFFGLGHNIGWVDNNSLAAYQRYFELLKDNGCNLIRVWINAPWAFPLEIDQLGYGNIEILEKIDSLLALAEKYSIYIILVLDTYGSLMDEKGAWGENFWEKNPYNIVCGGPCNKPWDFFTDKKAKEYYKDRIEYIIGRFSHSPNLIAFELWNELDAPADWTKEMASYIKSINPHKQLVTTSLGYPWGNNFDETAIWGLDEIDIIDRHVYGDQVKDTVENLISVNKELSKKYNKMIMVGEFGINANKSDAEIDKTGNAVALHNSLWASVFSRSFSGALNWWWAEYIRVKNLYSHYKALRRFINDINWDTADIDFIKTSPITILNANDSMQLREVIIKTKDSFGDTSYSEFNIDNNGNISGGLVNAYLQGDLNKYCKLKPVFHLDYPQDGKFILYVYMVSQGANLVIYLDDKEVVNKVFTAGPGDGPWKRSLFRKNENIYQCIYDLPIEVKVPKGRHTIRLENTGKDWIMMKKIILENYSGGNFVNVFLSGLMIDKEIIIWVRNKEFNWKNDIKGVKPISIDNASFTILDIEDGSYSIEWWDTFEGEIFLRDNIFADDGKLNILIPSFSKDCACKIKKTIF